MTSKRWMFLWLCFCWIAELGAQPDVRKLVGSPHDLSSSGRDDACGFCHTPHGVQAQVPLWSQDLSKATYKIYQSSSLQANVGQPTGSSKLCLSCHDGTVASPIASGAGVPWAFFRPGQANLGTDLSDDHPISFFYSDSLSARDPQIRPASTLPRHLKLDAAMELQCTTCHDPHNNQHGDFLTMSNERSLMCVSCHQLQGWAGSVHEGSGASVTGSHNPYLLKGPYSTVEQYACLSCHRQLGEISNHYQLGVKVETIAALASKSLVLKPKKVE